MAFPARKLIWYMRMADGYIWICTDRGLSRYNGYEFENFTTKDGLAYNTVFDIFEDKQQNLWITSFDGGVSIYDIQSKKIYPFPNNDRLKAINKSDIICRIGFGEDHADFFSSKFEYKLPYIYEIYLRQWHT